MIFSAVRDDFDTDILGLRTAKITLVEKPKAETSITQSVGELHKQLLDNGFEYASIRYPTEYFQLTHKLEDEGFRVVDVTVQLTAQINEPQSSKATYRIASKDDVNTVRKLAHGIFVHNRFFNDSLISNERSHELYATWAENCVLGKAADETLVVEDAGIMQGFIGIKRNGHVSLIGVSKDAQGKGIGKQLIIAALEKFGEWGLHESVLETQATNIPALRVYQGCGFKVTQSFITLRWSK